MRTFRFLVLAALVQIAATQAQAFSFDMRLREEVPFLTVSDTFTVDVFANIDPGVQLLSVALLFPDDGVIAYDGPASAAAPAFDGAGPGAQPSYLLYTPAAPMIPPTLLYPQQTPYWLEWAGIKPAGQEQINLNYVESALNSAQGSGTGLWIGSFVFHVMQAGGPLDIELCVDCGGNIIRANNVEIDPADIGVPAPLVVGAMTPEPTTGLLLGLGVLGALVVSRRTR